MKYGLVDANGTDDNTVGTHLIGVLTVVASVVESCTVAHVGHLTAALLNYFNPREANEPSQDTYSPEPDRED